MKDLRIWMRVGDQGEYESFDSLDEAVEELHSYLDMDDQCIGHDVNRYTGPALVGIEVGQFQGDNGVSLYWGDDDAQLVTPIDALELSIVERKLA